MDPSRRRVLRLLDEGLITPAEANALLDALPPDEPDVERTGSPGARRLAVGGRVPSDAPDLDRYRASWRITLGIALGVGALAGLSIMPVLNSAGGRFTAGVGCVSAVLALAVVTAVLALWSRRARWLHVRIREGGRTQATLSLPVPARWVRLGLRLARGRVGEEAAAQLDAAAARLDLAMDGGSWAGSQPLLISVEDAGGSGVHIYFG